MERTCYYIDMEKTNEDIIGRLDINDIKAILDVPKTDPNEINHSVKSRRRHHFHLGLHVNASTSAQAI